MTPRLTPHDIETLALARSLIRDMDQGWRSRELAARPKTVVARLTKMIGDLYDFETGDSGYPPPSRRR